MAERVARLLVFHAVTPLHPGTGQTTGIVDLPVQREVHTGFPMIAAAGVKGSLRDEAERRWGERSWIEVLFGPDTRRAAEGAGALALTDARILAFPVRSLQRVFVWVTCPLVLRRLRRDLALARLEGLAKAMEPPDVQAGRAVVAADFADPLVLEEVLLNVERGNGRVAGALADLAPEDVRNDLAERLVVVSDEAFQHFVRHCTHVSARIALNERKTTTGGEGNLWYEETLPPETVMYALVLADRPRVKREGGAALSTASDVARKFDDLFKERPYLQLGGNETVGQGWCRVVVHGADRRADPR